MSGRFQLATLPAWAALFCVLSAVPTMGQSVESVPVYPHHRHFHRHCLPFVWHGGHHASTVAEGYARGLADVIRARGESNLNNAVALRELEVARAQALQNKVLKVESFYARRELFRQKHAAEVAARRARAEERLAKLRLQELSPQELNPATGEITWPILLADEAFADYTEWFNGLFAERAKYGEVSAGALGEAEEIIKQWRAEVTAVRDQVPEEVLRESLRFLLRLDRELERQTS